MMITFSLYVVRSSSFAHCTRTKNEFRILPQLVDQEGRCKRCGIMYDDHPETLVTPPPPTNAAPTMDSYEISSFPDIEHLPVNYLDTYIYPLLPTCNLLMLPNHVKASNEVNMSCTQPLLTAKLAIWLGQNIPVNANECDCHFRNNGLFLLFQHFQHFSTHRNITTLSTIADTRPDMSINCMNIPLILIEENADNVMEAVADLQRNFIWIPHYHTLPFVFGIAISSSEVMFYELRPPTTNNPLHLIFATTLMDVEGRWKCVRAIINIARISLAWFIAHKFACSSIEFDKWVSRYLPPFIGTKSIRIGTRFVEHKLSDELYQRMKDFFEVIRVKKIPYIERLVGENDEANILRLEPIGMCRQPVNDTEMIQATQQIIQCIRALHKEGYLHNDLRWPNVIVDIQGNWIVIDTTIYCLITDTVRTKSYWDVLMGNNANQNINQHLPNMNSLCPRHDFYRIGLMIDVWVTRQQLLHYPQRQSHKVEALDKLSDYLMDSSVAVISAERLDTLLNGLNS